MTTTFSWIEYVACGLMLMLSSLVGIYYGCYKGNQNTVSEYMRGGKRMAVFPITISLITSHISAVTLLGVPEEVYKYGSQYSAVLCGCLSTFLLIRFLYLPVFYKLQLNSPYEYLERRFNRSVRLTTSTIFLISQILHFPIVIYVPALAFNQVSGVPVHAITLVVSLVCIFYTVLGGLKAVVWTDTLQCAFSFGSMIFIIVLGTISQDGLMNVIETNIQGHRLEMTNFDPNPFLRCTFWTTVIGISTVNWISHIAIHPGSIQRFTAVPTYKDAVKVAWGLFIGLIVVQVTCISVGFLIYGEYHDCDPIASKTVSKTGQIIPLYVTQIAKGFPGLSGLFMTGIITAALSSLSASLNSTAGLIYEDFVKLCCSRKHGDATASFIMKVIVIIIGLVSVALVFVVEKLGTIFQLAISMNGITGGTFAFVFTFGMLFPWGTSVGAFSGIIASMLITAWIGMGAQIAIATGRMKFPGKITSIDGCESNLTVPIAQNLTQTYEGIGSPVITDGTVPLIYQLSYGYYTVVGIITGTIVGIVVSLITKSPDLSKIDPDLIAPQMQRFLPKKENQTNVESVTPSAKEHQLNVTFKNYNVS